MSDLEPLNPEYVQTVLSNPPFVIIPGVHNARDLGSYSTQPSPSVSTYSSGNGHPSGSGNAQAHGSASTFVTRPGYMFRSAEVSGITKEGAYPLPLFLGIMH